MLKKLVQSYTRTSNTQPLVYPAKEEFEDEWNYIQTKYGNSLPTISSTDLSTNPNEIMTYIWEKVGEENIINDFVNDIVSETGKLHNRVIWCQNNNVTFTYEITEV